MGCLAVFSTVTIYLALTRVTVRGQNPEVKITEPQLAEGINTYVAQAGSMVDFRCVVRHKPLNRNVQWIHYVKSKNSTKMVSDGLEPMDQRFSIIQPDSISWKLRIKNVQVSSAGQYICQVKITTHTETTDVMYLMVMQQPRINNIMTSKDMTVDEGKPLDLYCDAEGIPQPTFKWTRLAFADLPGGGKEYRNKRLKVKSVKAEHRGKYICEAKNKGGSVKRTISIKVNFKPIVKPQHPTVYQKVGYGAELVCNIEGYPQPTMEQVYWQRTDEGANLESDENFKWRTTLGANDRVSTQLIITNVRSEDYGKYTCYATNSEDVEHHDIMLAQSDIRNIKAEPIRDQFGWSCQLTPSRTATFLLSVFTTVFISLGLR